MPNAVFFNSYKLKYQCYELQIALFHGREELLTVRSGMSC